jgi:hypothetical protein
LMEKQHICNHNTEEVAVCWCDTCELEENRCDICFDFSDDDKKDVTRSMLLSIGD